MGNQVFDKLSHDGSGSPFYNNNYKKAQYVVTRIKKHHDKTQ